MGQGKPFPAALVSPAWEFTRTSGNVLPWTVGNPPPSITVEEVKEAHEGGLSF